MQHADYIAFGVRFLAHVQGGSCHFTGLGEGSTEWEHTEKDRKNGYDLPFLHSAHPPS